MKKMDVKPKISQRKDRKENLGPVLVKPEGLIEAEVNVMEFWNPKRPHWSRDKMCFFIVFLRRNCSVWFDELIVTWGGWAKDDECWYGSHIVSKLSSVFTPLRKCSFVTRKFTALLHNANEANSLSPVCPFDYLLLDHKKAFRELTGLRIPYLVSSVMNRTTENVSLHFFVYGPKRQKKIPGLYGASGVLSFIPVSGGQLAPFSSDAGKVAVA